MEETSRWGRWKSGQEVDVGTAPRGARRRYVVVVRYELTHMAEVPSGRTATQFRLEQLNKIWVPTRARGMPNRVLGRDWICGAIPQSLTVENAWWCRAANTEGRNYSFADLTR